MKYRKLGNTGLEVSVLGFGASSLGGVFHQIDPEGCVKTVWAALDGGIARMRQGIKLSPRDRRLAFWGWALGGFLLRAKRRAGIRACSCRLFSKLSRAWRLDRSTQRRSR